MSKLKQILQKPYFLNRSKGDALEVRYQCNKKFVEVKGKEIKSLSRQEHGLVDPKLH